MGKCLKGKSECGSKDADYKCGKCGALTEKKKHLCKPEKIKKKK